jgi:predicted regulator of Ras-like GTPase activity (Roadblock/LC7/MglB family)
LPYRRILEGLLAAVAGSRSALLLDAQGELVVGAGELDERQRLIGAYQGIALGTASRAVARFEGGVVETLICRYERGTVLLATLKDGYYLVLSIGPLAVLGLARRQCESTRAKLNQEI